MSTALERRLSRLERSAGSLDDELVEFEFSDEAVQIVRDHAVILGKSPDAVSKRQLLPRSQLRPLVRKRTQCSSRPWQPFDNRH